MLYGRISRTGTRLADGTLRSDVKQEDETTQAADKRGNVVVSADLDMDVSGGLFKRPGFGRALAMFEGREADVMIVPTLDRFGRDMKVIYKALEIIEANGGYLVSVGEQIEDSRTDYGRNQIAMFGMMAQGQLDRIKSGWKWAHSAHMADGIPSKFPFGYERDENRRLVVTANGRRWVPVMFEMRAAGETFGAIARTLNAAGMKTRLGNDWLARSVELTLKNRAYLGEIKYGKLREVGVHEALVSEELFHAAQSVKPTRRLATRNQGLLSGLLRCSGCRYAMEYKPATGTRGAVYQCTGNHGAGRCPAPVSVNATQAHDYMMGWHRLRGDMVEAQQVTEDIAPLMADVRTWEQRVRDIEDDDELIALWTKPVYKQKLTEAKRGLSDAQARLAAATVGTEAASVTTPELEGMALDAQRRIFASMIDCVFLRGRPGRGKSVPIDGRILVLEAGDGPDKSELPRRGDRRVGVLPPFDFGDELVAGVEAL